MSSDLLSRETLRPGWRPSPQVDCLTVYVYLFPEKKATTTYRSMDIFHIFFSKSMVQYHHHTLNVATCIGQSRRVFLDGYKSCLAKEDLMHLSSLKRPSVVHITPNICFGGKEGLTHDSS